MRTSATNRFLTKALPTLCCAGALAAYPASATIVNWQLTSGGTGHAGTTKALSQSSSALTTLGVENTPVTDDSHQILFRTAPESGAATATAIDSTGALNNRPQASDPDLQQESASILTEGGARGPAGSEQSSESLLFAASNTLARPTTELDDAMARTAFDEEFVSVPTVQFASMARGSADVSVISAGNVGVLPVPEMSALFPIVGLIVAVSCTQILRRRRAAQQSAFRRLV